MLRNYLDLEYIKGFHPELENYLWSGETDFEKQKSISTKEVQNDLISKGLNPRQLSPELVLRNSGSIITEDETTESISDISNSLRLVIDNITADVSGKEITLEGSNDNETFYEVITVTVLTSSDIVTAEYDNIYKYYRLRSIVLTGSLDYRAYIVETKYDLLFAYKWLSIIFLNSQTDNEDKWHQWYQYYEEKYNRLLSSGQYELDINGDGIADVSNISNTLKIIR